MDLATLIGLVGGMAMVIMAMVLGGSLSMFVDVPSVLIVFVGTIFVAMMKFTLGGFLSAGKVAGKAFMFKIDSPEELIEQIVELADAARKGGLLSLEGKEIKNQFLAKGIQLLVDGHDGDVVKSMLSKDKSLAVERHKRGSAVFSAMGDIGPAMGMIGTLVGLVAMLSNMDDPKSIGPAMAVALLTTLYGAMLANMIALPIADKCKLRMGEEELIKSMIIDALLGIQAGQNPRVIEGVLRTYLPEGKRAKAE
ncbi:MAG: flagellar motor protein PomA [Hahellaceae bacterium]|nr:flagellar motor protein PomA [Hahellaceae bacterium]MCP5169874.1 flagellar motor protein PomA [Hahellaceae bacterium]